MSVRETENVKNIDHERIKRLPKDSLLLNEIARGIQDVLDGKTTFEELAKEQD